MGFPNMQFKGKRSPLLIPPSKTVYISLFFLSLEKGYAKDKIRRFLKKCEEKREMPVIYYSGHGEMGTGNWCFAGMEIKI